MAGVMMKFYPRINTVLKTDVLSRERKLERDYTV